MARKLKQNMVEAFELQLMRRSKYRLPLKIPYLILCKKSNHEKKSREKFFSSKFAFQKMQNSERF